MTAFLFRTVLVVFAFGCWAQAADDTIKGFTNAVAFRGTTQEDAPALELYLTEKPHAGVLEPAPPYLHVEVAWQDWSNLVGKKLELVPLSRHEVDSAKSIVRAEAVLNHHKSTWLKGTLRLNKVQVGEWVEGSYNFVDTAGRRWQGNFGAHWVTPRSPATDL